MGSKNTFPTIIHIWDVANAKIGAVRSSKSLEWKVVILLVVNRNSY